METDPLDSVDTATSSKRPQFTTHGFRKQETQDQYPKEHEC